MSEPVTARRWVSAQTDPTNLDQSVVDERVRQLAKWGVQHHGPEWWLVILTEEVGEFSQAICDLRWGGGNTAERVAHMRDELVQVAAVALSALADLDGHTETTSDTDHPELADDYDPARWWEPPDA